MVILSNGHVRFDGGRELDIEQLRTAIMNMKGLTHRPQVRITFAKDVHAESVTNVLLEFQRQGYDRIGLVANFRGASNQPK